MLRHRNLATVARNTIRGFEIDSTSVFLSIRPLWPIAQVILMSYLFAGATVVLRRFDPERFAALVQETGATRTSLVPTQLVRCLEHLQARDPRLDRLQAIHVGGSRIPPAVFERALEMLGPRIGVLYGLTEAPVTCYLPPRQLDTDAERRSRLIQSVGRALPEYERAHRRLGRALGSRIGRRSADPRRQRHGRLLAGRGGNTRGAARRLAAHRRRRRARRRRQSLDRRAGSRTSSAPAAAPSFRRKSRT